VFAWHSFSSVLNLNANLIAQAQNLNFGGLAAGVTVDIGEALLHDAKNGGFQVCGKPAELVRDH
jgi:hypothetical protein